MDFIRPYMDLYIDDSHKPIAKVSYFCLIMKVEIFHWKRCLLYNFITILSMCALQSCGCVNFSLIFLKIFPFSSGGTTLMVFFSYLPLIFSISFFLFKFFFLCLCWKIHNRRWHWEVIYFNSCFNLKNE